MLVSTGWTALVILLMLVSGAVGIYLLILLIRVLRKYLRSGEVRQENRAAVESLAKALKGHRERCRMTQEFVAESIGVSRQAVSKWETGAADPSTANLLALAKLACCRRSCCTTRKTEIHNIRKRRPKGRLFLASIAH